MIKRKFIPNRCYAPDHKLVIIPSSHRLRLKATLIKNMKKEDAGMDEYQEELLEFQAYELDTPEPADDATEL